MKREEHWENVHRDNPQSSVSWYEPEPTVSMALVGAVATQSDSVIDIGAGSADLIDHLIRRGWRDVAVLDISSVALDAVRSRFALADARPEFIVADVVNWVPERTWDVWHDRAVFHFMTSAEMRDGYKRAMARAVAPGGRAVIGTFAEDGPEKCSGIEVVRYSPASLAEQFGDSFEVITSRDQMHVTPWGAEQHFVWVVLKRRETTS